VEYVTVPTLELRCPYPSPGGAHSPPAGFMGGVGWPPDSCAGLRITDLAAAVTTAMSSSQIDRSNVALGRILEFYAKGSSFVLSRPQLLAFVHVYDTWWVREGMHRCVALAMLGAGEIEGVNFSTLTQAAA
jgi:hypothetical protein